MLKHLTLDRFKNFEHAGLDLGPFTVIMGTNASGKSNIRDAFRFLHGISRGYTVAEIIGEKWVEGGVLQWKGIRGGTREATYLGAETFALEVAFTFQDREVMPRQAEYRIELSVGTSARPPRVVAERLKIEGHAPYLFDSHPENVPLSHDDPTHLSAQMVTGTRGRPPVVQFLAHQPILTQIVEDRRLKASMRELVRMAIHELSGMRFLDLSPEAMRIASIPGQTILGDRGENLSSVLQAICGREDGKAALLEWLHELTPMDAVDFEFPADQSGRVLVTLVEQNGQRISAHSASDGTLRFLAMIAALSGPEPARLYFFEELENGIHPTRLHLLIQLIEQRACGGILQVVATTHSPQLLGFLGPATLERTFVTYRLERRADAQIIRVLDIPEARRVLESQDLASLHASGWLEDAVSFMNSAEAVV